MLDEGSVFMQHSASTTQGAVRDAMLVVLSVTLRTQLDNLRKAERILGLGYVGPQMRYAVSARTDGCARTLREDAF